MPLTPKRACEKPGCKTIVVNARYCEQHKPKDDRGNSSERGYDAAWQKVRKLKLLQEPLCEDPFKQHKENAVAATEVHHRVGVRVRPDLRLDIDNLMACCHVCHSRIERINERHNGAHH